jgi:uncharacterized ferredoxin-like protein
LTSYKVEEPEDVELEAVLIAAKLITAAARTAPKGCGSEILRDKLADRIVTRIVTGQLREQIAKVMEEKGSAKGQKRPLELYAYKRDAECLRQSPVVVLVGVKGTIPKNSGDSMRHLNCGACGYSSCEDFMAAEKKSGEDYRGPLCIFQVLDLGIALGSAVKMAAELCIDNRLFNTVGTAAMKMGLLDADLITGIMLSATGKNIYFDRN